MSTSSPQIGEPPTQSSIEDESKLSNLGKAADHFFD